jgi:hypothetical protein
MLTTSFHLPRGFGPEGELPTIDWIPPTPLDLYFTVSRAVLLSAPEHGLTSGRSSNSMQLVPGGKRFEISSLGERPELVKIVARGKSGALAFVPMEGECPHDSSSFWVSNDPTIAAGFTPRMYVHSMRQALEGGSGEPLTRYRRFFFEIDRRAEPRLRVGLSPSECDDLERHIDNSAAFLAVRSSFSARLKGYSSWPHRPHPQGRWAINGNDLAYVANVFEGLARQCFPHPARGVDLDETEDAIEMFANGELRMRLPGPEVWSTQPSSGSFHLFAELALLVLEQQPSNALWLRLANAFVRSQRIHARVYAPCARGSDGGWTRFDYTACCYRRARAFTGCERESLRREYAGMDSQTLARASAHHAWTAFPGER